jgi:hypothetical protein
VDCFSGELKADSKRMQGKGASAVGSGVPFPIPSGRAFLSAFVCLIVYDRYYVRVCIRVLAPRVLVTLSEIATGHVLVFVRFHASMCAGSAQHKQPDAAMSARICRTEVQKLIEACGGSMLIKPKSYSLFGFSTSMQHIGHQK